MNMVSPATGKDKFDGLWIHTELINEYCNEFFCLLFDPGKHLVIGAPHDMICIKIEDQISPAPAFIRHGTGIRFLVISS